MCLSKQTQTILNEILDIEGLNKEKYNKRTRDFLKFLPQNLSAETKTLDIGIAHGYFSALVRSEFGCETYGIDITPNSYINRYKKFDISFKSCDIVNENLPFPDDYFDLIFFQEVLEHLIVSHPPFDILSEIRRVVKENGKVIVSTPNSVALIKRIFFLFGNSSLYGFKDDLTIFGKHYKEYNCHELRWMFKNANFRIKKFKIVDNEPNQESFIFKLISYISKTYPPFRDTIIILLEK